MKYGLLLFSTLLFAVTLTAQRPHAVADVQHYSFALTLNDNNDQIQGVAKVTVRFLKDTRFIFLDLISEKADGKGMKVLRVTENDQSLIFRHAKDQLNIDLPGNVPAGSEKTVTIYYEGIPADGLIISNNKYKHRGFFGDNWPNRARNWIPCVDHPADKASVEWLVTAPNHYQVVANGVQLEETTLPSNLKLTHYKETVPISTKIMVIGVSDFAVQYTGDVQCIPVYSWVYPEDKEKGFYDYAQATEILPYFITQVGPYAFKKLANVQSKTIFGGMENAGAIFYSETSVTGTRKSESLLTHEIAHQWFGDMATESDWPHLWLSEGFATYMTILYFEHKYGKDTAQHMRQEDRLQVIGFNKQQPKAVVDTTVTNYMELLNANSYQKGGWVLHMLRRQLGDTLFWKGVRAYYAQYSGKNATTDDLRHVMEKVSGQDLQVFFRQWLFAPGQPVLDIQWKYEPAKKAVAVTIEQQQTQIFKFPLELLVQTQQGKNTTQTIRIIQKQTRISIPVSSAPLKLIPDPQVNLLFERAAGQ